MKKQQIVIIVILLVLCCFSSSASGIMVSYGLFEDEKSGQFGPGPTPGPSSSTPSSSTPSSSTPSSSTPSSSTPSSSTPSSSTPSFDRDCIWEDTNERKLVPITVQRCNKGGACTPAPSCNRHYKFNITQQQRGTGKGIEWIQSNIGEPFCQE